MNCNNQKCSKIVNTIYNCNKCDQVFCSNACMIDHVFQAHQSNFADQGKKSNFSIRRMSVVKSPFISQGEFQKECETDPFNDYGNLEYVIDGKTGKKKILGTGAFGEVFLAQHKKDNTKLFAVKHVYRILIDID